MRWISVLLASIAIAACDRPVDPTMDESAHCPELVRFDPVDAAADAAKIPAGEAYLLGVYGFAREVPGRVRADLPVRMIEGTSDFECANLNARTREYARRFNEAVQARAVP